MKPKTIFIFVALLLLPTTAQAQPATVEEAFQAITAKFSNFRVEKRDQKNSLFVIYTSQAPWWHKDARKLIDDFYRAVEQDTLGRIELKRIDAGSDKGYVRIWVPAGEATLGGEDENVITASYRTHEGGESGEVYYAMQWRGGDTGGYLLHLVLAVAKQGTTAFAREETPLRDLQMEELLDILSDTEYIDRMPLDRSADLLLRGVSLEALRAKVETDCELVKTMRQLRAEELQAAGDIYRQTLAEAKAFLEEHKTELRAAYEHGKSTHSEALRAGKLHSSEYAKRMQETADNYANGLKSLTGQYTQTVTTATDSYNATVGRIATQYADQTSLFPQGMPITSIDNAFLELLKAYDPSASSDTNRYILSKLRRLAAFAAPQMAAAPRLRWHELLPQQTDFTPLYQLLTQPTESPHK